MQIQSVTETIVNTLKNQIITGDIAPNTKLNEVEIARTFGVSRSPLREALRLLENVKFVTQIPRRGTFVVGFTSEGLEKIFTARKMIESFAVDIMENNNITNFPNAENALVACSKMKLPALDNRREMLDYVRSISDFHVGLIEATRNDYLINFYKALSVDMSRYQFIGLSLGTALISCSDHESILSNLKKAHYDRAKKEILKHAAYNSEILKAEIIRRENLKKEGYL